MFHVAAYTVALGTTADTDVAALSDDILSINNSHFTLTQPMQLMAACAMSATLSRARLVSPTLRQIASPWIRPIIAATLPPTNANMWLLDHSPLTLPAWEEIACQATSAIAMGTERFTALAFLGAGYDPVPSGNIIPLRWTSTTAAVANTWTTLSITFADTIPSGIYAVVGSEQFATNAIAHRWILSNHVWRPGAPSFATVGLRLPYSISKGQWGTWGRFRSNDLPRVQVLNNSTDAVHEGYLSVVRVGSLAA